MKRFIFTFVLVLFLLTSVSAGAEVVDRIVAIVNDDIITLREVEKYVAIEKKSRYSSMNEYTRSLQLREKLDTFIEGLLISQQARKLKIDVTDKEVESTVQNIRKQNMISESELKEQLKRENITYKDFTEGIKRSLLKNRLLARALAQDVQTDEKREKEYYTAHLADYSQDEYKLQHIFISGQRNDANARAKEAFAQLAKDRPFGEVVKEFSDEPSLEGGIAFVKKEELIPELRNSISLLIPGTHTGIVQTPYGYHILKLIETRKGETVPFEDVKDRIRERIFQEESANRYKEYISKLRSSSYIEVKI
jgi:peptidyl-prolyl cis-trans isomerase SurA